MYPGHNYGKTPSAQLGPQLDSNPFLDLATVADFVAHRMEGKTANSTLPSRPDWSP